MFQVLLNVASKEYEKEFEPNKKRRLRVKHFSQKLHSSLRKDSKLQNYLVENEQIFIQNQKGQEYFAFHREGKIWFDGHKTTLARFANLVLGWPKNGWEAAYIKDKNGNTIFLNDLPNREGVLRKDTKVL